MYRLQFFDRNCRILDDDDRIVFAGSFRECEEWLDLVENRSHTSAKPPPPVVERPSWLSRLRDSRLGRLIPRHRHDEKTGAVHSELRETESPPR
ncbi:MAG: hypothetical protein WBC44_08255 [Planctomycetaceae bacterium]